MYSEFEHPSHAKDYNENGTNCLPAYHAGIKVPTHGLTSVI